MSEELDPRPFEPDWVSHPGQTLSEVIIHQWCNDRNIDEEDREAISSICNGFGIITPELAKKFAELFGNSETFWNNRQAHYLKDCERLGITPNQG